MFDQGWDVSPNAAESQLVILFRHDSGDQGAGSLGVPGDDPGRDLIDGVLLVRIVHEISVTAGNDGVHQPADDDV
jgi:hypothetical protein